MTASVAASLSSAPSSPVLPVSQIPDMRNLQTRAKPFKGDRRKRDCRCPRARHKHGTRGAFRYDRCRCLPCRSVASEAAHTYNNGGSWIDGTVDSTGTRRRLEGLACLGWSQTALGRMLGVSANQIALYRNRTRTYLHTADRVKALYEKLCMTPAPDGYSASRAKAEAAKHGWVPPLAWDDIDDPDALPIVAPEGRLELRPHGTLAAYRRHLRHREEPCEACRTANALREDIAA